MGSGEKGEKEEKTAYKGLTKTQLACFFREFADKLEGISEETADTDTEDSTETAEVSEEVFEKIADAAEEASGETASAAEDSTETEEVSEEVSGKIIMIPNFDPENFQKLEMGIKKEEDGFSLKMKTSHAPKEEAEISPESGKKEKSRYKKTKKRMKEIFEEISDCLERNILPEEVIVASFLQDSRLMISFSEYGVQSFPEYDKVCTEFRKAFENKDIEACKTLCKELNSLRKDCHKRYKK
ncbi:MAG: GAK system XXXCH domain-containing protein [Desulfococcaceae bacterium]